MNLNLSKIFESKVFQGTIYGLGVAIVLILVFKAGEMVGYQKANFSHQWGENYYRNFVGRPNDMMKNIEGNGYLSAHGGVGKIIKIELPQLVIKGQQDIEKNILLDNNTSIKRFQETLKPSDLKIDDFIVVIGAANNFGQVQAKMIRLLPAPPEENLPPMLMMKISE